MSEPLRHPNCNGDHPGKEARVGPFARPQCYLCWMALNEPERVRALVERRPYAAEASKPVKAARGRWPLHVLLVALLRCTWAERGVGDTVYRRLKLIPGLVWAWERYHIRTTGHVCRACATRRAQWNAKYPYARWRWLSWPV